MLTFIFALIISAVGFWFGFKLIRLYISVKKWDRTEATVLSKKAEKHITSSTRNQYGIEVTYQYTYNGEKYTNNKVYLVELLSGQVDLMKSSAQKAADKLTNNPQIYVNPKHPEQSVIFCNGIFLYILMVLMGFVCLLMGLVALV